MELRIAHLAILLGNTSSNGLASVIAATFESKLIYLDHDYPQGYAITLSLRNIS